MVRDTTGKAIGVLIVMPELFYGGAETQFRYLAEGLVSRGLRVTLLIIGCYVDAEAREEVEWINEHPGIHVERLSGYGGRSKLNSFLPLYNDILKCINLNKIIITIVYDSLSTWLTPLICRHCAVLSSERNEGHPGRLLEHIRYLGAGKITCNSKVAFDNLSNDGFDPIYIPNGLPNKNPIPYATHKPKRILVPARICRMKNQVVVLEALENLSPEREYSVRFAGAIEDREYFDRIAKMPRGNHKIEFLGFVDNMLEQYAWSDLVILPSFSEGMPNVLLEAMGLGRFVIASNIQQNRELVEKQWLFNPNSGKELAELIINWEDEDSEKIIDMTLRQHEYITAEFSIEKMVNSYYRVIISLVG